MKTTTEINGYCPSCQYPIVSWKWEYCPKCGLRTYTFIEPERIDPKDWEKYHKNLIEA
jgi:rRNA maturation protein Nop10